MGDRATEFDPAVEKTEFEQMQFSRLPNEYSFNNLIVDLCYKLDECDNKFFHGEKYRWKDVISDEVDTWLGLFENLRTRGHISETNILHIQKLLFNVGETDLIEITMRYVNIKGSENVLHFYRQNIEFGDERLEIQIHVRGHKCTTQQQVQDIVQMAAKILCCPAEEIVISGVQPANSILISVVIPKLYARILAKFLQDKNRKHYFVQIAKLGVDHFIISGDKYVLQNQENCDPNSDFNAEQTLLETEISAQRRQHRQKIADCGRMKNDILKSQAYGNIDCSGKRKITQDEDPGDFAQSKRVKLETQILPDTTFQQQETKQKKKTEKNEMENQQNDPEFEEMSTENRTELINGNMDTVTKRQQQEKEDENQTAEQRITRLYSDPVRQGYIELNERDTLLSKKLELLVEMSTTWRKIVKPAENQEVEPEIQQVTPEEINAKSLYAKLNRIYPIPYIPKAAMVMKSTINAK